MNDIKDASMIGKELPEFAKDRFIKSDIFDNNQPNNVEVKAEVPELIKSESSVIVDPNTGMNKIVSDEYALGGAADVAITDIDEIKLGDNIETDENKETLKDFGVSDEDMALMFKLIRDFDNGDTSNMFNKLPTAFKAQCRMVCGGTMNISVLNKAAKEFVRELTVQLKIDKEFVDVQNSLNEELKKLDIGSLYTEYDQKRMDSIEVLADKYKEAGDTEAYQRIMDIKEPREEAISFSRLKEAAKNIKRLDKYTKRYEQVCRDFNYKYIQKTKFNFSITDVKSMGLCLRRHLPGDKYNEYDVMNFVVLFCRLCLNYSSDNIREHVFMYFTIKQVNMLDIFLQDKPEYLEILSRVEEVISIIRENSK